MHCLNVKGKLQAYVDGDLSSERTALLERHLAGCNGCRAELARLQTVMHALETWPLVVEPPWLTNRIMARVRSRPALPRFRLHWSDLAISLAGAGLILAAMLLWRSLALTSSAYLHCTQLHLRLEILRLEVFLQIRRLVGAGAIGWTWGLLAFVSITFAAVLAFLMWNRATLYPVFGRPDAVSSTTAGT